MNFDASTTYIGCIFSMSNAAVKPLSFLECRHMKSRRRDSRATKRNKRRSGRSCSQAGDVTNVSWHNEVSELSVRFSEQVNVYEFSNTFWCLFDQILQIVFSVFWFGILVPRPEKKAPHRNRGSSAASRGAVWGAAWGGSLLVCLIWLNDMKSILIFTSPVVVLTYFDTFKHCFCCFPFNVKNVLHYATVHFLTICSDQTGGSWLEDHPARVPAVPVVAVASNRSSKGTKRCQLEEWSKPDCVCIDVFLVYFRYFMSFSYFRVSSWCS